MEKKVEKDKEGRIKLTETVESTHTIAGLKQRKEQMVNQKKNLKFQMNKLSEDIKVVDGIIADAKKAGVKE